MTSPAKLILHKHGLDASETRTGQDRCLGSIILPFYAHDASQAPLMELLQCFDMASVSCPGLTAAEEIRSHHRVVHSYIRLEGQAFLIPDIFFLDDQKKSWLSGCENGDLFVQATICCHTTPRCVKCSMV